MDIENYVISHSSSTQSLQDPNTSSLVQYSLKTDIWGPKEAVILGIYKIPEMDFSICYGCRDNKQFEKILQFLHTHPDISVYSEEEGNIIFLFQNIRTQYQSMLIMLNVQKERTQSIKIAISFKG